MMLSDWAAGARSFHGFTTLAVRWVSRDVAIDGLTWTGRDGDRIQLSAEMDPPGGWVDVELDALTGRELSRRQRVSD